MARSDTHTHTRVQQLLKYFFLIRLLNSSPLTPTSSHDENNKKATTFVREN